MLRIHCRSMFGIHPFLGMKEPTLGLNVQDIMETELFIVLAMCMTKVSTKAVQLLRYAKFRLTNITGHLFSTFVFY